MTLEPQPSFADIVQMARRHGQNGNLVAARKAYRQAIKLDQKNSNLLLELGVLEAQYGEFIHARQALEKGLKLAPNDINLNFNLAEIARLKGEDLRAIRFYEATLHHDPEYNDALYGLADCYYIIGKPSQAQEPLDNYLANITDDPAAWHLQSLVKIAQNDRKAALQAARQAVSLEGTNVLFRLNLALLLIKGRAITAANEEIDQVLGNTGEISPAQQAELARLLSQLSRMDEAYIWAQKALNTQAQAKKSGIKITTLNNVELNMIIADYHQAHGDFDVAENIYRQILNDKQAPHGTILLRLALIKRLTDDDGATLEQACSDESDPDTQIDAHFAQYHLLTQQEKPAASFSALKSANDLAFDEKYWQAQRIESQVDAIINWFTPTRLQRLSDSGYDGEGAVFITGLPRSGTSLVEQLLATDENFQGGGELPFMPDLANSVASFPDNLSDDGQWYHHNGQKLHNNMMGLADRKHFISDKLPGNYAYIGLLKLLLPKAKIILCRRQPNDVALSIYEQNLTATLSFASNLEAIATMCHSFDRLSDHWLNTCNLDVHVVRYEQLVRDINVHGMALYNYIGLKWDSQIPKKMAHIERAVKTASVWQVRQPIATTAIDKWKRFETQLQPFIKAYGGLKE